jgi:hypothetical protein
VIRGEINSSASLSRVSMQADLTFRALIVATDDYGRMDARPDMLKAALYPTRPEATPAKIEKWLAELVEEGCVRLYEVDGRRYLALPGWEKHRGKQRRSAESRFPASPEILGNPGDPGPLGLGVGDDCKVEGVGVSRAPRSPPSCPEWALTLSDLLIEKVREVPGGRIPRGARPSWAREIAKLPGEVPSLAANGADPAMHIEAGIRWALGPENVGRDFEVVVRSGKALREKWPKLVAAARRQRAKTVPREGMEAWVKSYET